MKSKLGKITGNKTEAERRYHGCLKKLKYDKTLAGNNVLYFTHNHRLRHVNKYRATRAMNHELRHMRRE